jgi:DNA-binding transcriptional MerR regulator
MRIGELARATGVSADALRYYERLGLLPRASRSKGGYRQYDASSLARLGFIRKARALGLTLTEAREVLRIAADGAPPCAHVRATLAARLSQVDARIAELIALRETLRRALARSRSLPAAASCVCEIIESQELPLTLTERRRVRA